MHIQKTLIVITTFAKNLAIYKICYGIYIINIMFSGDSSMNPNLRSADDEACSLNWKTLNETLN